MKGSMHGDLLVLDAFGVLPPLTRADGPPEEVASAYSRWNVGLTTLRVNVSVPTAHFFCPVQAIKCADAPLPYRLHVHGAQRGTDANAAAGTAVGSLGGTIA